jgi:hypothetical protein
VQEQVVEEQRVPGRKLRSEDADAIGRPLNHCRRNRPVEERTVRTGVEHVVEAAWHDLQPRCVGATR